MDRRITLVVPQPAGNPTDALARKIQPLLQKELGQTVVVENHPGAGGSIGVRKLLAMPGEAILIASQTESILTPLAVAGARYQADDLRVIALAGRAAYVLAGRPDLPATTLAELVALAKMTDRPPLSHGHIGPGSMIFLLGEQWSRKLGLSLTQVPYKGVPPAVQDLMGGQIDLSFIPLGGSTQALIETGKVRAFGITSAAASPQLPRLAPLSKQNGALSDFVYGTWAALLVPRATSEAAVKRLDSAMARVLQDAEIRAYLQSTGTELVEPMSLQQLDVFYRSETSLYRRLAVELGVTPQ